jgi:hypothetical protein
MVMEEIYILTKHANFSSNYVENIPVYKRRYYLELLKTEMEETKKHQEREMRKSKNSHK